MNASAVVTAGFVLLPLLVSAGFVLACEWAGRRLGEAAGLRRRRATRVGAAVFAWLLITALITATGVLRRFDATPPPFAGLALAVGIFGVAVPLSPWGPCSFAACRSGFWSAFRSSDSRSSS
jgi:hypothetical protein